MATVLAMVAISSCASQASGVVGGGPANPAAWPWAVALLRADEPNPRLARFCSGTIVRGEWVLTAAHCVYDDTGQPLRPQQIDVGVGAFDLAALTPAQRIRAARIVVYPGYSAQRFGRDVALIQLAQPSGLAPAELTLGSLDSETGWVAGFGANDLGSTSLLTGQVSVSTPLGCARFTRSLPRSLFPHSPWGTICATLPDSLEASACFGDSGGPLVDFGFRQPLVVGVVSYGPGFCGSGITTVYSDVGAYRPWISRVTAGLDPSLGLPEVTGVFARDMGRGLKFQARWCQTNGAGRPVRVQFVADRLSPAPRSFAIIHEVRGTAPSGCVRATRRVPDRYRNGLYEVRVKVIERSSGLTSYGLPVLMRVAFP